MTETTFFPLATVTQRPAVSVDRIERLVLLNHLDRSDARIVIIKAPAGFGKTTLAVDWSIRLEKGGAKVAWLRAEDEHNEASVFLHYLANAIDRVCPGAGRAALDVLQHRALAPANAVTAALINSLVEGGEEVVLFIDEFDHITSSPVQQIIWFLLQHAPFHFRLVMTTREEPGFPMAALIASGEAIEIDGRQLRFSLEETKRFFERDASWSLDDSQIQAFQRETGGWAAALRMIFTSLRSGGKAEALIKEGISGGRTIKHYFSDTMRRLPEWTSRFMIVSSMMGVMTADKCNYVMQISHAEESLDVIHYKYQLILRSEAGPEGTYSYSYLPLVANYLKKEAKRLPLEEYRLYQQRAAEWCHRNGFEVDAIHHAIEAGDTELAAGWIERCGMELVKHGSIRLVLGWRRWIPPELMRRQFSLRLAMAWSLVLSPDRADAFDWVERIEADARETEPAALEDILRECIAIRAAAYSFSDRPEEALELAVRYVKGPLPDTWVNNAVGNIFRFGYLMTGRHELVEGVPWYPMEAGGYARATPLDIYRFALLGLSRSQRLSFSEAEAYFLKARVAAAAYGRPRSCVAAIPEAFLAHLAYERNELGEAEKLLESRLERLSAAGFLEVTARAYTMLARIAVAKRDFVLAERILARAERVAEDERWPRMTAAVLVERIRLALDRQDRPTVSTALAELEGLAKRADVAGAGGWEYIKGYLSVARALEAMAANRHADAAGFLRPIFDGLIAHGNDYFAARIGGLLAASEFALGNEEEAVARFLSIAGMTAAAGAIRVLADSGAVLSNVVALARTRAAKQGARPELIEYLAKLQKTLRPESDDSAAATSHDAKPVTPLAPREIDVLTFMAKGQSNKVIAQNMGVSPETVKSYIKSIFLKLEVDNRMRAVTEGRRLNLISDFAAE